MELFAKERQNKIYDMIRSNGAVTTAKLMDCFRVSVETVRRDLLALEQSGKLTRVHGGAVAKNGMKPYRKLKERNHEFEKQKRELSLTAAEFISEGDVIGIESGSTAVAFAEVLKSRFSNLTVVTCSVDVFELLCNHKDFSVILCAGHYLREENAFCGELTLAMLERLHVRKVFLCPSTVSLAHGIFDFQKELYQVQKKMLEMADEVYILADSSKFEKTGLLKLDEMKSDYIYITDSDLPEEFVKIYRENERKIYFGGGSCENAE